jgi:hypothetical protein
MDNARSGFRSAIGCVVHCKGWGVGDQWEKGRDAAAAIAMIETKKLYFIWSAVFLIGLPIWLWLSGARWPNLRVVRLVKYVNERVPWPVLVLTPSILFLAVGLGRFLYDRWDGFDWLTQTSWFLWPAVIITVFVLFCLRGVWPAAYGCVEIFVGVTTISIATQIVGVSPPRLLSLASGIYIIIRGLDNVDKGIPNSWRPQWWPRPPRRHVDRGAPGA